MKERIRIRRDSAYNWNFYNPVLATGEAGYETDTNRLKVGNGSGTWSQLPYLIGSNIYSLNFGDGSSDALTWSVNDTLSVDILVVEIKDIPQLKYRHWVGH